jgi:hypothetical protein
MDSLRKKRILDVIRRELGSREAIVVNAALEIAWAEWTPAYDIKYGSLVANYLLGTHPATDICPHCGTREVHVEGCPNQPTQGGSHE